MADNDTIENYETCLSAIAQAAQDAERDAGDVSLTIVTKMFPAERITALIDHGARVFGENRVQEAQAKWPTLKAATEGLRLHLIGQLQTNKAVEAVSLFDVIETLDRPKLADALATAMTKTGRRPDLFVQVNTGEEPQKGGVLPGDTLDLVRYARDELALPVVGLMAIPPTDDAPAPHFALLHELARAAELPRLSMGMSGDYEIAVTLGATDVRVGSGIMGPRPQG